MKCAICHNGTTEEAYSSMLLERGVTTLVFKRIPSHVCTNCGEEYISSEMSRKVLTQAEEAMQRGITLELLDFSEQGQHTSFSP